MFEHLMQRTENIMDFVIKINYYRYFTFPLERILEMRR